MTGLPRMKDESRPRDAWMVLVCGGVERLTEALRRGDPFSEKSVNDMMLLRNRLDAFNVALEMRLKAKEEK